MTTPRALGWIKPWMVVVTLTVIAAVGATAVYFAGEAQHRRDRADILRWEARALPAARDAEALQRSLRPGMSPFEVMSVQKTLQLDLGVIIGSAGPPLPEIVRPAANAYLQAITKTEASVTAIGKPGEFEAAQRRARAAFAAAAAAVQTLVCRARLPACSSP